MKKNHLIIGIGKTGGATLCALRKRIYEEFLSNSPESCAYVEYLYIDSDETELKNEGGWTVYGKSVQLSQSQFFHIHLEQTVSGKLIELDSPYVPESVDARINSCVNSLQQRSGTDCVTFHIVASLGDSIEEKCVTDLIKIIRQKYPFFGANSEMYKFRIFLYLALPSTSDEESSKRTHDELILLNNVAVSAEPFHRAYIYNSKVEVSNQVADFLFWKIIECEGFLRCECDDYYTHGMVVPARDGNPALSLRFMTFGFCRVETCERELGEYAASSLAQQTAPLIAGEGHNRPTIDRYEIDNFLLSDDYLTLSKPTPQKNILEKTGVQSSMTWR